MLLVGGPNPPVATYIYSASVLPQMTLLYDRHFMRWYYALMFFWSR
jgi:hypothetical protein